MASRGEVSEDEPQAVRELALELMRGITRQLRVGTFVIAVLNERDDHVSATMRVIVSRPGVASPGVLTGVLVGSSADMNNPFAARRCLPERAVDRHLVESAGQGRKLRIRQLGAEQLPHVTEMDRPPQRDAQRQPR